MVIVEHDLKHLFFRVSMYLLLSLSCFGLTFAFESKVVL